MQKQFTLFSSALAIAFAVLSLTGCRKDLIEPNPVDSVGPIGGGNTVTLDLPVSETDGFVNVTTKSVISENSSSSSYEEGLQKLEALEGKYSDVTVFQFDSGNKLVATYYQIFPEGNGGGIYVKSISGIKDEEYTFWAVANAGDLSGFVSNGDDVSKMADLVLEMPSVETNLVQYWEKGFPKVAKTELTTIDSSNPKFKLKFDRLVARVLFSLTTNLKYGSFEVTSLAVRQCNSKVYPFGTSKAVKVEDVMTGEMTSQIDLEALNSNDGSMYAYFYVPENMQGVPASLEGNTNPKNKNAQTIGEPLASLSTYLELTGVYTEGSGQLQTENHYRAYLGQNATNNLDVHRNTSTRFALSLKDDSSVLKGDWSADRNYDPSMDQRELTISPNPIQVSNEVGGVFTVYSKGVRYNKYCKYSLSQNLVDAGVVIDGYVLRQTKELDSDVEGTLTATSWDGVKTATATVKALKYAPAVIITPTPSASSSSIETMQMRMTAPVQTKTLYPKVMLSDGTQATITALESPTTAALEEGNTSYSKPIMKGKGSLSNNFYYQIEVTAGKEGNATIHNTCDLTVEYDDTYWAKGEDSPTTVKKSMKIKAVNDIDLTVEEDRLISFTSIPDMICSGDPADYTFLKVCTNFDGELSFSISDTSLGLTIQSVGGEKKSSYSFTAGEEKEIIFDYSGHELTSVYLCANYAKGEIDEFSNRCKLNLYYQKPYLEVDCSNPYIYWRDFDGESMRQGENGPWSEYPTILLHKSNGSIEEIPYDDPNLTYDWTDNQDYTLNGSLLSKYEKTFSGQNYPEYYIEISSDDRRVAVDTWYVDGNEYPQGGSTIWCNVGYKLSNGEWAYGDYGIIPFEGKWQIPNPTLTKLYFSYSSCNLEPGSMSDYLYLNFDLERNGETWTETIPVSRLSGFVETVPEVNGVKIGSFNGCGQFRFSHYDANMGTSNYPVTISVSSDRILNDPHMGSHAKPYYTCETPLTATCTINCRASVIPNFSLNSAVKASLRLYTGSMYGQVLNFSTTSYVKYADSYIYADRYCPYWNYVDDGDQGNGYIEWRENPDWKYTVSLPEPIVVLVTDDGNVQYIPLNECKITDFDGNEFSSFPFEYKTRTCSSGTVSNISFFIDYDFWYKLKKYKFHVIYKAVATCE